MAVHRIIEGHAARHGETLAIADAGVRLSYRELNQKANVVARYLMDQGFRRGMLATVSMPRTWDTAIMLLGILKAGGGYVLLAGDEPDARWPRGVSIEEKVEGDEVRYLAVDVGPALTQSPQSSANLPILSRESDIACVIPDGDGAPLLVPHATIMSLQPRTAPRFAEWTGDAGALDLWAGLMSGATVRLNGHALRSAA